MQIISDWYGEQRPKRLAINRVGVQLIRQNSQLGSGVGDLDERAGTRLSSPGSPSPTLFSGMPTLEPSGWLDPSAFIVTYPIVPYKLNARVSWYGFPVGPSNIAVASREALF